MAYTDRRDSALKILEEAHTEWAEASEAHAAALVHALLALAAAIHERHP